MQFAPRRALHELTTDCQDRPTSSRPAEATSSATEGLNLLVKEVKRCGRGFENFEHHLLRVLLRARRRHGHNDPHHQSPEPHISTLTRRAKQF